MSQNGKTHFQNLALFAPRFVKCVWQFWDDMALELILCIVSQNGQAHRQSLAAFCGNNFEVCLTILGSYALKAHITYLLFFQDWKSILISGKNVLIFIHHCLKSVQIRSFIWSIPIRTEYGEIRSISPYSIRMRENTGQKKLRTWTLFT